MLPNFTRNMHACMFAQQVRRGRQPPAPTNRPQQGLFFNSSAGRSPADKDTLDKGLSHIPQHTPQSPWGDIQQTQTTHI